MSNSIIFLLIVIFFLILFLFNKQNLGVLQTVGLIWLNNSWFYRWKPKLLSYLCVINYFYKFNYSVIGRVFINPAMPDQKNIFTSKHIDISKWIQLTTGYSKRDRTWRTSDTGRIVLKTHLRANQIRMQMQFLYFYVAILQLNHFYKFRTIN